MSKSANKALLLCLAISLGNAPYASAKMSGEQLQAQITKAKILPADTKITASVNGSELTVSTYRVDIATENDCKIDAVLIAKTAFDTDSDLSRAMVLFYDPRVPTTYSEIDVTLGDVEAYKAGKVSKEQLLSALKMTTSGSGGGITTTETRTTTTKSESQSSTGDNQTTETKTSSTSVSSASKDASDIGATVSNIATALIPKPIKPNQPSPGATGSVYSNYGVSFVYPSQWRPEYPRGSNIVVRFLTSGASMLPSAVEMQVYPQNSVSVSDITDDDPRNTFEEDWQRLWVLATPGILQGHIEHEIEEWREENTKAQNYYINKGQPSAYKQWKYKRRNQWSTVTPVTMPGTVTIAKTVHAAQRAFYLSPRMGERLYIREVAFSHAGCTIVMGIFGPEKDASAVSSHFQQLLASVKLSAAPAVKATKKKTK